MNTKRSKFKTSITSLLKACGHTWNTAGAGMGLPPGPRPIPSSIYIMVAVQHHSCTIGYYHSVESIFDLIDD